MIVNIHLVDILDATIVGTCRADILKRVTALLQPGYALANAKIKNEADKHSFKVAFATAKPAPADTDVIVYFLPPDHWSVITFEETGRHEKALYAAHWGVTRLRSGAGGAAASAKTEIFVKSANGIGLGTLVVHEMLHAKTGKDNDALHNHGGGGMAAAEVSGESVMNAQNQLDIASTITKPVKPWLSGWDIITNAKRQRDSKDPLADLFE